MRLDPLRPVARACADAAPLYYDRGDALYVTTADAAPFEAAGFRAVSRGAWRALYPTAAQLPLLRAALPPAACFSRFQGRDVREAELRLLVLALKGEPSPALEKALRQLAALCLRAGGGGALDVLEGLILTNYSENCRRRDTT